MVSFSCHGCKKQACLSIASNGRAKRRGRPPGSASRGMPRRRAPPVAWRDVRPHRRTAGTAPAADVRRPAQRRLARRGPVRLGAILSAALGSVAGVYGDERPRACSGRCCTPSHSPRRSRCGGASPRSWSSSSRWSSSSAVTLRIPEIYVGNIALFIAMYTVGAWVDDRRRAAVVRVGDHRRRCSCGCSSPCSSRRPTAPTRDSRGPGCSRRSWRCMLHPVPRQRGLLRRRVLHGRPRVRRRHVDARRSSSAPSSSSASAR